MSLARWWVAAGRVLNFLNWKRIENLAGFPRQISPLLYRNLTVYIIRHAAARNI